MLGDKYWTAEEVYDGTAAPLDEDTADMPNNTPCLTNVMPMNRTCYIIMLDFDLLSSHVNSSSRHGPQILTLIKAIYCVQSVATFLKWITVRFLRNINEVSVPGQYRKVVNITNYLQSGVCYI